MTVQGSLRNVFAALVVLSVLLVGFGYATSATESTFESHLNDTGVINPDAQIAPEANGITVIATDSNSWLGLTSDGPRARAELVAFNPNGTVLYYNDSHTRYWDVDPVPGTRTTVEYLYADHIDGSNCPDFLSLSYWQRHPYAHSVDRSIWMKYARAQQHVGACTRNGITRVNLTTGESTVVYSAITPGKHVTRWHDGDRINATHYVVADIYLDRIFVVDTETGEITWTWNARQAFDPATTGGPYPGDWTHINDVEVLPDGRFMVSVRNHDRVVFIEPGEGLQEAWTLGEKNNYDILYEQHNPDYIPPENGGPAVIVADSENNRVVEYQRVDSVASETQRADGEAVDGEWEQTWIWRDARMQWPRDADRLPNGHTLIADSNANRVFEVNENGEIVWEINIAFPYEAERLSTGDESTGGSSAVRAGIDSRRPQLDERFWVAIKNFIPGKYLNGLMYITPVWMGVPEVFWIALGLVGLFGLIGTELWRRATARRDGSPDGIAARRDD